MSLCQAYIIFFVSLHVDKGRCLHSPPISDLIQYASTYAENLFFLIIVFRLLFLYCFVDGMSSNRSLPVIVLVNCILAYGVLSGTIILKTTTTLKATEVSGRPSLHVFGPLVLIQGNLNAAIS